MLFSLLFVVFYKAGLIQSIRFGVSDVITISSIILGILGVFIGVLIGQHENSKFFKITKRENRDQIFFGSLMKKIEKQFLINIIFIMTTVLCDFLPSNNNNNLKMIFLFIWSWLFMITLWGVFYIIDIIVSISINDSEYNDRPEKEHK